MSQISQVIVLCESAGDGECMAYGPFEGTTESAAIRTARVWLRRQPCRPGRADSFWTTGALHCEQTEEGGTQGCWHHIAVLVAA